MDFEPINDDHAKRFGTAILAGLKTRGRIKYCIR
jgi:hypothetical protein